MLLRSNNEVENVAEDRNISTFHILQSNDPRSDSLQSNSKADWDIYQTGLQFPMIILVIAQSWFPSPDGPRPF